MPLQVHGIKIQCMLLCTKHLCVTSKQDTMCVWVELNMVLRFFCLGVFVNFPASYPAVFIGTAQCGNMFESPSGASLHVFIIYSRSQWSSQMELLSCVQSLEEPSGKMRWLFCVKAWVVRSVTDEFWRRKRKHRRFRLCNITTKMATKCLRIWIHLRLTRSLKFIPNVKCIK